VINPIQGLTFDSKSWALSHNIIHRLPRSIIKYEIKPCQIEWLLYLSVINFVNSHKVFVVCSNFYRDFHFF